MRALRSSAPDAEPVHLERLAQLGADAQRGVERRGRVLRHVRDEARRARERRAAPESARMSTSPTRMLPRGDRARRAACGRAAARPTVVLPDPDSPTSPSTSPGAIVNDDLVDDVDARCRAARCAGPRRRRRLRRRSLGGPPAVDADGGARDAVPDQARADREQRDRGDRQHDAPRLRRRARAAFSLIIMPQLAPFGSVEKPRNASAAMRPIE